MELSTHHESIMQVDRALGCVHLRHDLEVQERQVFRALKRWLDTAPPELDLAPPMEDAFDENPHRWLQVYKIDVQTPPSAELVQLRRLSKASSARSVADVYRRYADEGLGYEEIQEREARGFGRALLQVGMRSIACRLGLWRPSSDLEFAGEVLPTTFDAIVHILLTQLDLSFEDAVGKTAEFLSSDHVAMTPFANLNARLHAALAMSARGPTARKVRESDEFDIRHLATFAPYVDILVADRFFASLCSQQHLGQALGTQVRSLGEKEISRFVKDLSGLSETCPHRPLARRVQSAIREGGYHKDMAERMKAFLASRGISVPQSDAHGRGGT
jgi:hypothetical protein